MFIQWEGAAFYGIGVHSLLTFYWIAETLRNVVHTTVAGSLAAWYFQGDSYRVANPTLGAFRRATTYSFGSICFGSFLVALLMTIRRVLQMLQHSKSNRNIFLLILAIIARIFLVFVEAILRFFNRYVFTVVAIYGVSYIQAAKKTIALFGERGFEMVMQNNIVVSIISASTIVGAFSMALVGYLLSSSLGLDSYAAAIISACLALFIVEGAFALLESGSMSVMVCYFLHRAKLQMSRPELYLMMEQAEAKIRE